MKVTRLAEIDPRVFTRAVADVVEQFSVRPVSPEARRVILGTEPQALLDHLFDHSGTPFFEMPINGKTVRLCDERVFDGRMAGNA